MENFNILVNYERPSRLVGESKKDEEYHLKMANWCANNGMNHQWSEHQARIIRNKNFFLPDRQWTVEEDIATFLNDDYGSTRNRLKVEMNYIQSMVNQYVGNAIRMNITARARSISPMVKTRKEEQLAKLLFFTNIAKDTGDDSLRNKLRNEYPIGSTPEETEAIFENIYVDKSIQAINNLLANLEVRNNFSGKKGRTAEHMALSGMCIHKPYVHSGDLKVKFVEPERFIFDRSSKETNFSDAWYMGEYDRMMPTDIYERFVDLDKETLFAIEEYSRNFSGSVYELSTDKDGRIPVFTMYWRDCVEDTWGYVLDEYNQTIFVRINYKEEFENKPRWTEKDVVNCSKLDTGQKDVIGKDSGKAMKKTYTDQWRFCSFIPPDAIGTKKMNKMGIMVDYGIMPYQEKDLYSSGNMATPYKVATYIYIDGDVYAPVDIAINPQRMINRFYSVFENQVNSSGGSGLVYDPDMVENEDDFLDAVANSKPAAIRTKGMPMQNVVTSYDNTIGKGTVSMIEFANVFKSGLDQITGVNEAMKGENLGSEQLVGVTQLMIQKGTVIQQRFYNAIENLFKEDYQHFATVGKRVYANNRIALVNMVGDGGADIIEISKDMKLEDFRVEIATTPDPQQERMLIDQKIIQYLQLGLIDQKRASNLLERATSIDLSIALRDFAREKAEVERRTAEQQQMMMQQQMMAQQEEQGRQEARQDQVMNAQLEQQGADRQSKLLETAMKVSAQKQPEQQM